MKKMSRGSCRYRVVSMGCVKSTTDFIGYGLVSRENREVEWAVQDGTVWYLQSQPLTTD